MPAQGQVYALKNILPPGQPNWHRIVVLSRNYALSASGATFAMVGIIRSANKNNRPVRRVIGHSILLPGGTISTLPDDGLIETHQLFAIPLLEFQKVSPDGNLPQTILEEVLEGARLLFSRP